jgi:hypothetical protein
MELDRRGLITAALATSAAAVTPALGKGRGGKAVPLDLATPAGRMRVFMMIRGALDDRLVTSWISARYYGVVEDRMDPLFGVVSAVFARYRPLPDGGWEGVNAELAWFTDAVTGTVLDTFLNPYTGKQVKVPSGGFAPSKVRFGPDLSFHLAHAVPGLEMNHEILPFDLRGDDLWITERSRSAMTFPGAAKPFRYSESNTFHARRSALEVPGVMQVPSDVSFTNVTSWRPWMEMGDLPGHLMATGIGRQGALRDSLPPAWVAATSARRPEVLKDPAAVLAPLWNAA